MGASEHRRRTWWAPGPVGVVIVILAGVVFNLCVAVAIGLERRQWGPNWPPTYGTDEAEMPGYLRVYGPLRASTFVDPRFTGVEHWDWWFSDVAMDKPGIWPVGDHAGDHAFVVRTHRTGWPIGTLEKDEFDIYDRRWTVQAFKATKLEWLERAGLRAGVLYAGEDPKDRWDQSYWKIVPVIPHWRGVVGGGLFWAGMMWAPVVAWRWRARRRAARRGGCTGCGYDLRGLKVCPECGLG